MAARTRLASLSAQPYLERCDRELAACGHPQARLQPGPTAALTPQELTVARLVAAGRTNRQVAADLVVSVKTIEYHLSNAYAKLAVTSRTQLALALRKTRETPRAARRGFPYRSSAEQGGSVRIIVDLHHTDDEGVYGAVIADVHGTSEPQPFTRIGRKFSDCSRPSRPRPPRANHPMQVA